MRTISLCAGIEGIGLGLSLVLPIEPVLFVERDPFCQRVLAARYPGVPIGNDLFMAALAIWAERFRDPSHGYADLLTAGFPCQPWSAAGLRLGTEDDRWLWPLIAQWIRLVRPRYIFLENVPGLLSGGAGYVLGDLAAMGYDAAWGVFSCEALGASHRRQRVFILAHCNGCGLSGAVCGRHQQAAGSGARVADADSQRPEGRGGRGLWEQPTAAGRSPEVGDADRPGYVPEQRPVGGRHEPSATGPDGTLGNPCGGRLGRDDGRQPGQEPTHGRGNLGDPTGPRCAGWGLDSGPGPGARGEHLADPQSLRGQNGATPRERSGGHPSGCPQLADADQQQPQPTQQPHGGVLGGIGGRHHGGQRPGTLWAPGPWAEWGAIDRRLWPATEPPLCRVADGRAYRLERSERRARLKALGNSVSAPACAVAWCVLSAELEGSLR